MPTRFIIIIIWLIIVMITLEVNRVQPEPYMDEIFHHRQTDAYCHQRWTYWDPALTTPPGAYLLPLITIRFCSDVVHDRLINTIWFVVAALLINGLLDQQQKHHGPDETRHHLQLIAILTHPILIFHTFLYYTDIPSLAITMATLLAIRSRYLNLGALLGAISITMRQTNLIWLMFACAEQVLIDLGLDRGHVPISLASLLKRLRRQYGAILFRYGSSIGVGLLAVGLFLANGGAVVLGDRNNHSVRLHLVQVLYFAAFACLASGPGPLRLPSLPVAIVLTPVLALIVQWTTYAHPFIRSDNRHYIFYIWKNFFARYEWFRYGLIPIYMISINTIIERFHKVSLSALWQIVFGLCLSLCLIPSPLIDMRYFLIPFVIFSIHDRSRSRSDLIANIALNVVCNVITIGVFLYRPFTWPDGSIARFMW